MIRTMQAVRIVLPVVCVLLGHAAIVYGVHALAVAVALAYACANVAIVWLGAGRPTWRTPWLIPVVLLLGAQVAASLGHSSVVAIILAPSIIVNLLFLILFGHTLLPGREPLITRFRRLEVGHVAPVFVSYTRRLTVAWTVLFAVATTASVFAAIWGDLALWSWIAFIGIPFAGLLFFVGEHVYRAFRYGEDGRSSPLRTVQLLLHPDAWQVHLRGQAAFDGSRYD